MHGRQPWYAQGGNLGSHREFLPDAPMWRLEFPMALGRMHELNGGNIPWVTAPFYDADMEAFFPYNYTRYIAWAYDSGIVRGHAVAEGPPPFRPGNSLTRQEAAAMFFRYARFLAQSGDDATCGYTR